MHDIMHSDQNSRVLGTSSIRRSRRPTGFVNGGRATLPIEAKVGAAGEFGFYGKRFVAKIIVEELSPVTRVRWKVSNAAWPGSDIEFNLKADGNDTTLVFAHRGFPRADEGYASATTRWGLYLLSLKRYLETGKGTPNPDDSEAVRLRCAQRRSKCGCALMMGMASSLRSSQ